MKPIKHATVINKLVWSGFEPAVNPDDPDQFMVIDDAGNMVGTWCRKPTGEAARLKANGHRRAFKSATKFIDELKKARDPNRIMN